MPPNKMIAARKAKAVFDFFIRSFFSASSSASISASSMMSSIRLLYLFFSSGDSVVMVGFMFKLLLVSQKMVAPE